MTAPKKLLRARKEWSMAALTLLGLALFLMGGWPVAQAQLTGPLAVPGAHRKTNVEESDDPLPAVGEESAVSLGKPSLEVPHAGAASASIPPKSPATHPLPKINNAPGMPADWYATPLSRWQRSEAQAQMGNIADSSRDTFPFTIRLELPGTEILFRLEAEDALKERMRQEAKQRDPGKKVEFPNPGSIVSGQPYGPRLGPSLVEVVEPNYVGYRRLYFNQINATRYGWDLGLFHPLIAAGTFYFDLATYPLQWAADPFRHFEFNTGYPLPGDPVPLLLYPPRPK